VDLERRVRLHGKTNHHITRRYRTLSRSRNIGGPELRDLDLERRSRRQNSVLADRRASNGFVVGGPGAAVGVVDVDVGRSASPAELHRRCIVHGDSCQDAAGSSENLSIGGRRPSAVDTNLLLSAILTQLRYITASMRRHCKRVEVKDEWKTVAKFTSIETPRLYARPT